MNIKFNLFLTDHSLLKRQMMPSKSITIIGNRSIPLKSIVKKYCSPPGCLESISAAKIYKQIK
ncbi:MAG: hypothetical protein H6Q13_2973 [Bacteroidetes bacterium]|nr:hypothetical protein [Bacteroidota bacterium]